MLIHACSPDGDGVVAKALSRRYTVREHRALSLDGVDGDDVSVILLEAKRVDSALLPRIRSFSRLQPVIVVCPDIRPQTIVAAVRAGAMDYLAAPPEPGPLQNAVRSALQVARKQLAHRIRLARRLARFHQLTPREKEVTLLLLDALPNKRIATELGISEKTVEVHRRRAMKKMQSRNIVEMVRGVLEIHDLIDHGRRRRRYLVSRDGSTDGA